MKPEDQHDALQPVADHLPAAIAEAGPAARELPPDEAAPKGGWFIAPAIEALFCSHDVRLPSGSTVVTLHTAGWGWLRVDASVRGQTFRHRSFALTPAPRSLDLVVPVDSLLAVRFRNSFGTAEQTLLAAPTADSAPRVPRFAGVTGTQMPPVRRPLVDGSGLRRLPAPDVATFVTALRPMPPLLLQRERLSARLKPGALASINDSCSGLPDQIGRRQQYRRELMLARYQGVTAPDVDMTPVQRQLLDWMAHIHHGPGDDDAADSGQQSIAVQDGMTGATRINANEEA